MSEWKGPECVVIGAIGAHPDGEETWVLTAVPYNSNLVRRYMADVGDTCTEETASDD